MTEENLPEKTEFLFYQSEDGRLKLEVRLQDETLWMTQSDMANLFQCSTDNISLHLKNIYEEGELTHEATTEEFSVVRMEGSRQIRRNLKFYNLDMIVSLGYRVKSHIATRFRIWATQRLREYIIKGFTMDDERLKRAGGGNYFEELLARIRDIRSSEKVFWRKVLDIYATSIDYDPNTDSSREFFARVQNKMHWAAHGKTAAEVIYGRADASKPNMGLSSWTGSKIRKNEVEIAKNYLNEEELNLLNRIVTLYLDFAELQALNRKPMYMQDWIERLDEFLKVSGRDILTHAGKISHDEALKKAHKEYEEYRKELLKQPTEVERHFLEAEKEIRKLGNADRQSDEERNYPAS